MDRNQAFEELSVRLENKDNINNSLGVEAIMRKLARYLHQDAELWSLTGLMHDIDIERVNYNMMLHGMLGGDILEGLGFDETLVYAVRAHNPNNNYPRRRKIDKALFCAEPMASLILKCVNNTSEKKLDKVDVSTVINCYSEKGLISEAEKEQINSCNELGINLEKFIELSLEAMKEISSNLEL